MRLLPPVMLACLVCGVSAAAPVPQVPTAEKRVEMIKEKESGHRFPATAKSVLRDADKDDEQVEPLTMKLLGLGIREKTVFKVNVYSYVLYVDRSFAEKDLAPWKGKKLSAVEKDKKLFAKLLGKGGTKELRLRFCRDVDADDVVSAFEDSLEPRLLKRREDEKGTKAEKLADLGTFRKMFTLDELKDGKELRFTWHPDGTLTTIIDGKRQNDLKSPDLCWALFDVYLGDDPISSSGKKKLVSRVPTVAGK